MLIPSFIDEVPHNGYRWWYIDAISDNGQQALTVIVFIGSVFSPYYAWARRRGNTPALNHCAVNVALYGKPWRWCMTERTEASVQASEHELRIGNSEISIQGNKLVVSIDEIAVPLPQAVRGRLDIALPEHSTGPVALDGRAEHKSVTDSGSTHFWQPIAPQTPISVCFTQPNLTWKGTAYVDSNYGSQPLESTFKSWQWSRSHSADGRTHVLYDVLDREEQQRCQSLCFAADGSCTTPVASDHHQLPRTRYWRIPRRLRTPHGVTVKALQTLEDTPFYSRSKLVEQHADTTWNTVHESLFLERFDSHWVRCLLPFRMPRVTRPTGSK